MLFETRVARTLDTSDVPYSAVSRLSTDAGSRINEADSHTWRTLVLAFWTVETRWACWRTALKSHRPGRRLDSQDWQSRPLVVLCGENLFGGHGHLWDSLLCIIDWLRRMYSYRQSRCFPVANHFNKSVRRGLPLSRRKNRYCAMCILLLLINSWHL
jgi:hypothetical protein